MITFEQSFIFILVFEKNQTYNKTVQSKEKGKTCEVILVAVHDPI